MSNKTKTILIIIGVVILFFVAGSLGEKEKNTSNLSTDPQQIMANAEEDSVAASSLPQKEFTEITASEYLSFYQGSEEKLILLARPTCGYCQIVEPIIKSIAYDNDIEIYYLNTDNFTGDDQMIFVTSNEKFNEGYGTPLLFIVKDSKIIDEVDGLSDRAHYEAFLKYHNYIKG